MSEPSVSHDVLSVIQFRRVRDFIYRVISKADEDNIFFMAGAISFNVLVAFVPIIVLILGIAGYVVSARFADPGAELVALLMTTLPDGGADLNLAGVVADAIEAVVADRGGLSLVGALILIWVSTRLVGTLRTVVAEVFDVAHDRGILLGKLFDAVAVVVGGALVLLNVSATVILRAVGEFGMGLLRLEGEQLRFSQWFLAQFVAFASIWILFLFTYRILPARRWYLVNLADFGSTYGNLATVIILFLWIYYSSVVFILGGEVAQVYTMRRVRKRRAPESSVATAAGIALLAAGAVVVLPGEVVGQSLEPSGGVAYSTRSLPRGVDMDLPLLEYDGPYIVVHLAENRVYVLEDGESIFSAPAGTGTGFRLAGAGKRWKFTTPEGLFKVKRKEKDPLWEAPDWYYVEKGLPVPAQNSTSRLMRGIMGTTAIYLGDGIAIHGTNQPGLLLNPDPEARRVSHGCIRLTNEDARTLFHMVDVGTPVLIF
jgi:membrane protein